MNNEYFVEKSIRDKDTYEASKEAYRKAKANLKRDRIAVISNEILKPYIIFQEELKIVKYNMMIARLEKEKAKAERKAEELRKKEERKAIRDKRKEDIVSFINDRKDDVIDFANNKKSDAIDFGKDIGSEVSDTFDYIKKMGANRVSSVSSFVSNVSNSALKKVRENTTIDLTIKNAIEDIKLKYATNKYNRAVEKKEKEAEKVREQELDDAINFDKGVKIELKSRDVPFSNINEKIQKARKQSSYMGKATNRVVRYFKSKKDNLFSDIQNKVYETGFNMRVSAYEVMGKVSKAKSEVKIVFNNELNDLKANVVGRYNDVKRDIKEKVDSVSYAYQDYKDKTEDERKEKRQNLAIKRAQLENMRQALESVNNTGNIFENAPSLDVGRTMK